MEINYLLAVKAQRWTVFKLIQIGRDHDNDHAGYTQSSKRLFKKLIIFFPSSPCRKGHTLRFSSRKRSTVFNITPGSS